VSVNMSGHLFQTCLPGISVRTHVNGPTIASPSKALARHLMAAFQPDYSTRYSE